MNSYSLTDIGRCRRMNQDSVFCSTAPVGNLSNLFIVADGMGGHRAGNRASELTIQKMLETIETSTETEPVTLLQKAVYEANRAVFLESMEDGNCRGMGTTVVAATLKEDRLYICNVGDSRLYIIHGDKQKREKNRYGDTLPHQITLDHSMVEEMVRSGKISHEEARNHPDKNIITRAVGTQPDVYADLFEEELEKNDIILLCSDGLTNMVDDEVIARIVDESENVEKATQHLVELANRNGGYDNITVILIEYDFGSAAGGEA